MLECPHCGELPQPDTIKCRSCGQWMDDVAAMPIGSLDSPSPTCVSRAFRYEIHREYRCILSPDSQVLKITLTNVSDTGALIAVPAKSPVRGTRVYLFEKGEVLRQPGSEEGILPDDACTGEVVRIDPSGQFAIRFMEKGSGWHIYTGAVTSDKLCITSTEHAGHAVVAVEGNMSFQLAAIVDQVIRMVCDEAPAAILDLRGVSASPALDVLAVGIKQSPALRERIVAVSTDAAVGSRFGTGPQSIPVRDTIRAARPVVTRITGA